MNRQKAQALRAAIVAASASLDDATALTAPELYPRWDAAATYAAGDRVYHYGTLYKCLQPHTAQAAWTPTDAPSLWAQVLAVDDTISEWTQPDSTNGYMIGDRVSFEGSVYESVIDNNVWSPSAYPQGWRAV